MRPSVEPTAGAASRRAGQSSPSRSVADISTRPMYTAPLSAKTPTVVAVPMPPDEHWSPWLFSQATRRRGAVPSEPLPYDPERQVSVAQVDGRTVAAVELSVPPQTKKADIEKGEDQKDRW
jgi:hypothetical protein